MSLENFRRLLLKIRIKILRHFGNNCLVWLRSLLGQLCPIYLFVLLHHLRPPEVEKCFFFTFTMYKAIKNKAIDHRLNSILMVSKTKTKKNTHQILNISQYVFVFLKYITKLVHLCLNGQIFIYTALM